MSWPRFYRPETVQQAVEYLSSGDKAVVLGGGTLVQPAVNVGAADYNVVVDLSSLGLDQVLVEDARVTCGAMVRLADLARELPQHAFIQTAVASIGGPAVRNLASVGGNLFAKSPYGDLAVLLLALDAEVELVDANGARWRLLDEWYHSFGDSPSGNRGFLLTRIRFDTSQWRVVFRKFARRQLNSAAVVTVVVSLRLNRNRVEDARVALGGVDKRPIRAPSVERVLTGEQLNAEVIESAAIAALGDCSPQTDAYASAWYRKKMVPVQVRRTLNAFV